ncbi:hypothetical protein [Parathalassolituus penaei]|uniref:Uncharacterized protein n=1 Tax=Parathalassolituus penaei TaxID=2997323 RepID=A0A9X3EBC7_9GAMM|nr:hypothetical protein [Parathalassolituus penaei]MCY0964110.1 hypothetical protein [Parathalassolituus penaei]
MASDYNDQGIVGQLNPEPLMLKDVTGVKCPTIASDKIIKVVETTNILIKPQEMHGAL